MDCGSSNSYISAGDVAADHLLSAGIRRLDAVVLTHYHADHANGLALLLARVGVDTLYLPDIAEEDGEKSEVLALSERYGVEVRYVTEETQTAVGEASLTLYPPVGEGGENELGLTILCSAGEFDTLITGDMDSRTERVLVSSYPLPDIEVLLVGHHGSRYSTSEELLGAVMPEVGVVSVGSNSYGHPTAEAIGRLEDAGAEVYRTDEQGTIVAASDGTTLTWNMSPSESWQAGEAEKSQNTEKSEKAADSQNNAETDAAVSNPTDQTDGNSDVIVHITKTGEKYHSAGCQYLRKSDIEVTLSEAKAKGLTPCSKCNPPQ